MKLITKEIEKKLLATPVNSTRDKSPEDIPVIVKFFGGYRHYGPDVPGCVTGPRAKGL